MFAADDFVSGENVCFTGILVAIPSYRGENSAVPDHSALLIESLNNQLYLLQGSNSEGDKLLS